MSTANDQATLASNIQFKEFPGRVQSWILESATASEQFAEFFRDGGRIYPDEFELHAKYVEQNPDTKSPTINVNSKLHPLVRYDEKSDLINAEKQIFTMVAHEIGHHAINSRESLKTFHLWHDVSSGRPSDGVFDDQPVCP